MNHRSMGWKLFSGGILCLLLNACAIQKYPGQPGVRTNGFAKIDMEYLDESGLWVYEVSYDNAKGGEGVEQIVTKLYPSAYTYTSNVRTNADGTNFRHKFPIKGATIQMISLPKTNTVVVPPDSQFTIAVGYKKSLNEVDDRNLAEDDVFGPVHELGKVVDDLRWKWDILRAGQFGDGRLNYSISKIKLDNEELDLSSKPVLLSTTMNQSGIFLSASKEQKQQLRGFINEKFPQGFDGVLEAVLSSGQSIKIPLSLSTIETMKASGTQLEVKDLNPHETVEATQGAH